MFFENEIRRVAVIAAHPDDETVGAGGTMARLARSGIEVYVCVVTRAYEPDWTAEEIDSIRKRAERAFSVLGVTRSAFLGYPTVKLNTVPNKELTDALKRLIEEARPDAVLAPYQGDLNQDHGIVARAAAVAARPSGRKGPAFLHYEVLSSTEWGRMYGGSCFRPNLYVDIEEMLETKIEAMRAYGAELKDFPHPLSEEGIRALARLRGMEAGLSSAEAFCLAVLTV